MAIKKPKPRGKLTVNLDGPDGNANVLLAMARGWARQTGEDWEEIRKEAMSSDYIHLLKTLQDHFGDYVDFETTNAELLKSA